MNEESEDPFGGDPLSPPAESGSDASAPKPTDDPAPPPEPPKTPEEEVIQVAQDLAKQTRDVPTILKAVKATIQRRYPDLAQAAGIVAALHNTGDSTLSAVGQQLDRYMKATQ